MIIKSCHTCGIEVKRTKSQIKKSKSGNIFCSHKCVALYSNKHSKLMIENRLKPKKRICKKCNIMYIPEKGQSSKKLCKQCFIYFKPYSEDITLGDFKQRFNNRQRFQIFSKLRDLCRLWNKDLYNYPCQKCGYNFYIEFCHIKPLSIFDDQSFLKEMNGPKNILILCPNHHVEFDKGLLKLEDIPPRNK